MNAALKEADVHVLNKDLDDEETEAKFPAIKRKYRMKKLTLVVDSETEGEMKVHAHREINPKKDGKQGTKEEGELEKDLKIIAQHSFDVLKSEWFFTGRDKSIKFALIGKPVEIEKLMEPTEKASFDDYIKDK